MHICVYVHFVEAHISPLIYALSILSGPHIFALIFSTHLFFLCVLVRFPHLNCIGTCTRHNELSLYSDPSEVHEATFSSGVCRYDT